MRATIIRNVSGCLAISLVGSLGSIGTAALGSLALWAAFTKELPWIAASWPDLNAWPVLGLLTMQVLSSMLLGVAIASQAMWWITDCFEAER